MTPDSIGFCVPCGSQGQLTCEDGDPTCDAGYNQVGDRCYSNCAGASEVICLDGKCQNWHFDTGIAICAGGGGDFLNRKSCAVPGEA